MNDDDVRTLSSAKSRLRNLESLSISLSRPSNMAMLTDVFDIAPKLKAVSLNMVERIRGHTFRLPWGQLTDLQIDVNNIDGDVLFGVLSQSFNLQRLHLFLVIPALTAITHRPAILLQHLQSLVLKSRESPGDLEDPSTTLLDHLLLPTLRDFDYCEEGVSWEGQSMVSLLSRSRCSLQKMSLSLINGDTGNVGLIDILRLTPNLEELYFESPFNRDSLSRLIADGGSGPVLVPKLRVIAFTDEYGDGFDFDLFLDMVESRCQPPGNFSSTTEHSLSTLESISFEMDFLIKDVKHNSNLGHAFQRLYRLLNEGLSISYMDRYRKKADLKVDPADPFSAFEPEMFS